MGRVTGICAGVFLTMVLFIHCKKEYSYEGGVAVFTVLGTGGSCAAVLSGNYYAGIRLDNTNTVRLTVHVTNPGKFTLQTNSQGGFLFSTSGSLSDTGIQTIVLTASGLPAAIGDYDLTPDIDASCNFSVSVTGKQELHSVYTLTGAPGACSSPQISGQYQLGTAMSSANFVVLTVDVDSLGDYAIRTDTLSGIYFSATGTFTKTGLQTVTLTGYGKPDDARHLVFTPKGNNGSGCSFDFTVERAGTPATYVIVSGGGYCIGSAAGAYTAGTPLTAANTYSMQVFVKFPGNFTIATKTVNGVYFYYSGEFTAEGDQNVTLTGYGTPAAIGTFTLTPQIIGPAPLGGVACEFSLEVK